MIYTVSLNPAIDRTLKVDRLIPYEINTAEAVGYVPAGKGVNVCRTLSCLNTPATVLGLIGEDEKQWFTSSLEKQGIQSRFITIDGITRISTTIIDSTAQKETHIKEQGFTVSPDALKNLIDEISATVTKEDTVCLTGSAPPGVTPEHLKEICQILTEKSGYSVYDIGGNLLREVSSCPSDLIKPNREELEELTGKSDIDNMLKKAHQWGFKNILLTLGGEGAFLSDKDSRIFCKAPAITLASTVGAGDASLAGFLAALNTGTDNGEALKWAVAAGSANAEEPFAGEINKERFEELLDTLRVQ